MKRTRSRFFKVKEYHDFRDGRVLVKRELITRKEVEKYKYPPDMIGVRMTTNMQKAIENFLKLDELRYN